jgi:hypothetical protein
MARTLRYNRMFAEAGRGDPEMRDEEKRSWLDELKETLGFQSRQRRPRKKMPMRARFSGYYRGLAAMILSSTSCLAETINRIPIASSRSPPAKSKASPSAKMILGASSKRQEGRLWHAALSHHSCSRPRFGE